MGTKERFDGTDVFGRTVRRRYTAAMSMIVIRNVADMPETSRRQLEELLGAALAPHQRVVIIVDALYQAKVSSHERQR